MIERSKNVQAAWSKNVSARERRSPSNDAITIAKMRSFRVVGASPASTSSVSTPLPSLCTTIATPSDPTKARAPIPVWSLTGDAITALSATVALQLSETPAVAFTFNLTPDAIAKAKDSPTGFLDPLKRSFDLELKRALKGTVLPYWFAIDVTDEGRLHIHGAFLSPATNLPMVRKIRTAMKAAWGEWEGPGKRKQLRFKTLYSDDWATYCMEDQAKVAKIIGPRTFTISQPLRRDAEWAYSEIRRIMRRGADT
jgi:hypothetical protein